MKTAATQRELAEIFEMTPQALAHAHKRGRIRKGARGRWPIEDNARRLVETARDPTKLPVPVLELAGCVPGRGDDPEPDPGPVAEGDAEFGGSILDDKARKLKAEADYRELQVAIKRGELMPADEVRDLFAQLGASHRSELLSWASSTGPQLAQELGVEPGQCTARLSWWVRRYLEGRVTAVDHAA